MERKEASISVVDEVNQSASLRLSPSRIYAWQLITLQEEWPGLKVAVGKLPGPLGLHIGSCRGLPFDRVLYGPPN